MEQALSFSDQAEQLARARCSLEGLSVGDAFGARFFYQRELNEQRLAEHRLAEPPWPYTDDTEMALSIVAMLRLYGTID